MFSYGPHSLGPDQETPVQYKTWPAPEAGRVWKDTDWSQKYMTLYRYNTEREIYTVYKLGYFRPLLFLPFFMVSPSLEFAQT